MEDIGPQFGEGQSKRAVGDEQKCEQHEHHPPCQIHSDPDPEFTGRHDELAAR